jgi:hypothetical protein
VLQGGKHLAAVIKDGKLVRLDGGVDDDPLTFEHGRLTPMVTT